MTDALSIVLISLSLVAAAWSAVLAVIGRWLQLSKRDVLALLALVALVLLGLLVQAVYGFVALAGTDQEIDTGSFVLYQLGAPIILGLATYWGLTERSRWGPGVLLVGCLAVPVMVVRLQQLWAGHG